MAVSALAAGVSAQPNFFDDFDVGLDSMLWDGAFAFGPNFVSHGTVPEAIEGRTTARLASVFGNNTLVEYVLRQPFELREGGSASAMFYTTNPNPPSGSIDELLSLGVSGAGFAYRVGVFGGNYGRDRTAFGSAQTLLEEELISTDTPGVDDGIWRYNQWYRLSLTFQTGLVIARIQADDGSGLILSAPLPGPPIGRTATVTLRQRMQTPNTDYPIISNVDWVRHTGMGPAPCNPADIAPPFGVLDLADIDALIAAFLAQDPLADLAPPAGVIDLADIDAFIDAFLGGCP